jgi:hypothetical protein
MSSSANAAKRRWTRLLKILSPLPIQFLPSSPCQLIELEISPTAVAPDPSAVAQHIRSGSWLCENNSACRSGARLIQAECPLRMKDSLGGKFASFVARQQLLATFSHRCAGRPARSRWCESTTMKEQRTTSALSRAQASVRMPAKRRQVRPFRSIKPCPVSLKSIRARAYQPYDCG